MMAGVGKQDVPGEFPFGQPPAVLLEIRFWALDQKCSTLLTRHVCVASKSASAIFFC